MKPASHGDNPQEQATVRPSLLPLPGTQAQAMGPRATQPRQPLGRAAVERGAAARSNEAAVDADAARPPRGQARRSGRA